MYQGIPSKGKDFFNLLMQSDEFNQELGKLTLAAGRLEAELIHLYKRKGVKEELSQYTLGRLIHYGKDNNLLEPNLVSALRTVCKQRNYITHNIYALFADLMDETILPKDNLIETDVLVYIEKAWETRKNLIDLSDSLRDE